MKKILIVGAGGQLASCFEEIKLDSNFEFIFKSEKELDLTIEKDVALFFNETKVDFCINCAAYTQVDKAEIDSKLAHKINATAVGSLAKTCKEHGVKFVHISTDYVFDGTSTTPYKETDQTNPLGVYGITKLEGEKLALDQNPESIVIRTAWVYSAYNQNFVKTMLRLITERDELNVVSDQFGHPTCALDLAKDIIKIIETNNWVAGIYHYSNLGEISWFDFAKRIAELKNFKTKVNPISTEEYPTPAKRPAYSVLDKTKIVETFGLNLKDWEISLKETLDKLS